MCIGGKVTVFELHCHVDVGFVVSRFASCKKTDIFPCKTQVELHVVYVGAYPTIPACFGQVDKIVVKFVDVVQLQLEVGEFVVSKVAFIPQLMLQSVLFFDGRNEYRFACFVPSFTFALDGDSCFTAGTYNGFTKGVIGHVARGECK